jgi:hypothetical protein
MIEQAFNIIPGQVAISAIIWVVILIAVLYFARKQAHQAIYALSKVIYEAMRLTAKSIKHAEVRLTERNRDVLLSEGAESSENHIEQEFNRVNKIVERDLGKFPVLQRTLFDQISRIDDDYQNSSDLVPDPPDWIEAVEAVAKLKENRTGATADILERIHESIVIQRKDSIEEYRKSVSKHHLILNKLMPYWRKLTENLGKLEKTIDGIKIRSTRIDSKMENYEEIRNGSDKAERILKSSSIITFIISAFALAIGVGGAIVNFNLIALPMSEMMGGGSYIGSFKTSHVAAMVIILLEISIGFYLMDAMRITKLFPIIGQMDDKMRRKMILITLSILTILACIESSLAMMREQIASNRMALVQTLTEGSKVDPSSDPTILYGQMVLGFILPFTLAVVAIPFESFVHSCRTVVGSLMLYVLQFLSYFFRLIGNLSVSIGKLFISIYDLFIFPTLWLEDQFKREKKVESKESETKEEEINA